MSKGFAKGQAHLADAEDPGEGPPHLRVSPRSDSGCRGVKVKHATGAALEGLAQVITGPVGHGALGLVQQRGRRSIVGVWPVRDTAAGKDVDHLGCATGSLDLEAFDARRDGLPLPAH